MDVFYSQAATGASGPLTFGAELRLTDQSFNPNLWGSIKAITPFIGDYDRPHRRCHHRIRGLDGQPRHQPDSKRC